MSDLIVVSGGQISTGIVVSSGWTLEVLSGGSAVSATVLSGGFETISSGGTAIGTILSSGGEDVVSSGGVASRTVLSGGPVSFMGMGGALTEQVVYGSAIDTIVSSGGEEIVSAGGVASGTVLDSGSATMMDGTLNEQLVYGSAIGTIVSSGSSEYVYSGGIASGTRVNSGGSEYVWSGGVAEVTTISSGATLTVSSGGSATGTIVSSGGTEFVAIVVSAGQTSSGLVVGSGQTLYVDAGGSAVSTTVISGGADFILSGGTAIGTVVGFNGEESVDSGGVASGTTLSNGGQQHLQAGTAISTTVSSGGSETVAGGFMYGGTQGTTLDTNVKSGGFEFVSSGGVASATTVSSGGTLSAMLGGSTTGTVALAGATVIVPIIVGSGQTASGLVVGSGETLYVQAGGSAVSTTLTGGGYEVVSSGGTAIGTTVSSGAITVDAGGVASGTVLAGPPQLGMGTYNDQQTVYGTAVGTVVNDGEEYVYAGGVASGTTVNSGGEQYISAGSAVSTTVNSGGLESVQGYNYLSMGMGVELGVTISTTLNNGGVEDVNSVGVASTTTVSSGGALIIGLGGSATGTIQLSGGAVIQSVISSGQTSSGVIVGFGEVLYVLSGGSAVDTTVLGGGSEYVSSGGIAIGTTVSGGTSVGGQITVSSGGMASGTVLVGAPPSSTGWYQGEQAVYGSAVGTIVSSGGAEFVYSGGVASGTALNYAGSQYVWGGSAVSTTVNSGGTESVSGGFMSGIVGTTLDTRLNSGGQESVSSGGIASATTISSGGTLSIGVGGSATATNSLTGGTVIQPIVISAGQTSSGLVIGSGEALYVLSGGSAVSTTIIGGGAEYISSGGTAIHTVASGGSIGGTEVTVSLGGVASGTILVGSPPSITGSYLAEQAVYGSAAGTVVSSGGYEFVGAGAIASGTTVDSGGQQNVWAGSAISTTVNSGGMESVGGSTFYFLSGPSLESGVTIGTRLISDGVEDVSSGGIASATTVSSGGTLSIGFGGSATATNSLTGGTVIQPIVISSGQTSSGLYIGSGEALYVLSGGSAVGTTVVSGGAEYVSSGGTAIGTIVSGGATAGGEITVSSGGVASGTVLTGAPPSSLGSYQAEEFVYGSAAGTVVSSGGYEDVGPGGVVSGTTLNSGGQQFIWGGSAVSTTVNIGGWETVEGGTGFAGISNVAVSGTTLDTRINSGGAEYISSGGIANATTVSSGATLSIGVGGSATGTNLLTGGAVIQPMVVSSGQTSSGLVVGSGEVLYVLAGGKAIDTTVLSGGNEYVSSGGEAIGTQVDGGSYTGGEITVSAGGLATGTVLTGSPASGAYGLAQQFVLGSAIGTIVSGGGAEYVSFGGVATSTTIDSGGQQWISGGSAISTTVNSGGSEGVGASYSTSTMTGTTLDTRVNAGGIEYVSSGGIASATTVSSGGVLSVGAGGSAVAPVISNGGAELFPLIVSAGQTSSGIVVSSGQILYVQSGGSAVNAIVRSGGSAFVSSGGMTTGMIVSGGGDETVISAGSSLNTSIGSGGYEGVINGTASGTVVGSGGYESVLGGWQYGFASSGQTSSTGTGVTIGTTIRSGGFEVVSSGGIAEGTVVSSGGTLVLLPGGLASGTVTSTGGIVVSPGVVVWSGSAVVSAVSGTLSGLVVSGMEGVSVLSHGTTVSSLILTGAFETVSGGTASSTTISSGGDESVSAGGLTIGSILKSGAYQGVDSGGTADGTVVSQGGIERINGGIASGTTVSSGGFESVSGGYGSSAPGVITGTAIGTIVDGGGSQTVASGGVAISTTVNSGGVEAVFSGGTASDTTLNIGGTVDLAFLAFAGGGSASVNLATDLLTVSEGGKTYTQQLAGSYSGDSFQLTADAYGGTRIIAQGGNMSGLIVSSGVSQSVNSGQTTTSTTVLSGGAEFVSSGGTAIATTVDAGGLEQVSWGGKTSGTVLSSGGYEIVSGASVSTTIGSGGAEVVDGGDTATATTVDSGGFLIVNPGGSATGTVVRAGGTVVSSGIVAGQLGRSPTLYATSAVGLTGGNSLGWLVLPGGTLISTTANSGTDIAVYSGGKASASIISSGGWQDVHWGGTASGTIIDGGTEFVLSGGVAVSTTVNLAGSAYAYSAGVEYVSSGGIAYAATVNSGAQQDVSSGGSAISTTVNSGGFENVSGGTTTGTVVNSGGFELVSAGGTASGTQVNSGGALVVFSGGTADAAVVSAGGLLIELPGGAASGAAGTVVSSGVVVYEPGTGASYYPTLASGVVVGSGGTEFILPGGTATNTTLLAGGIIDVTTLAYVSGGSVSLNASTDVLTVTEGGQTYTQQLSGTYMGVAFVLSPDDNGEGTFITETAAAAGSVSIAAGTTVTVGTLTAGESIAFAGSGAPGVLILGSPSGIMPNPITGFAGGDAIEFANGATVTAASILNSDTLAVSYHIGSGGTLTYDFTDVAFASPAPQSVRTYYDFVTNEYAVAAVTYLVWTGASSTNFASATNWSAGTTVPGLANYALFNAATGGTISGSGSVEGMSFLNTGTWTLASSANLTAVSGIMIAGGGGGTNTVGALTIGSGATVSTPGGYIDVGASSGDVASLTLSGGGVLKETAAENPLNYIMYVGTGGTSGTLAAASGTVLVSGAGSLLDLPFAGIEIGNNGGSGSVTVSQGGSIYAVTQNSNDADSLAIGRTGNGTLTVTGPGSQVTGVGVAYVAHTASGVLTVENSGTLLLEPDATGLAGIDIGFGNTAGVGGLGIATVTTGGDLVSQGSVAVGVWGTSGELTVSNSGTVQVGTTLAVGTGGTIQNGTSYAGNGTLTIGAGGTVELTGGAQTASFGVLLASSNNNQLTSSEAVVTVSGAGALLNTDGNGIAVGQFGTASLTVSQGGSVLAGTENSSSVVALGIGKQGSGTVTVTGSGSQLTANGGAWVGRAGSGSLVIANQGSVLIGVDGTGSGGITIGGAGLSNGSTLFTGGTGTASVTTGGVLSSTQAVNVGRNGDSGSLSVTGGTVVAGTDLVIGASTTLAAGGYDVVGNGMTQVAAAMAFNGNGTVTVGTGGLVEIGANGLGAGVAGLVIGSAAGGTGNLSVSGGTVLAAGGLSIFQGSTVSVSSGGGIDVGASGSISAGAINVDSGYAITGDGLVRDSVVNNSGTIAAFGAGTLEITGAVVGSGRLELNSGSVLRLDGTIGAGQSIVFDAGTAETLILGTPPTSFTNSVSGLTAGDRIEFAGLKVTGAAAASASAITVRTSTGNYILNNVTFASGQAAVLTTGTDAVTGDAFVLVGATALPPTITGTVADQAATDNATIAPFGNVTIADANLGQTETVTVTLSAAANGSLTHLGGGSYNAATGVYTDTGSAAAVTAALDGLVFTPTLHEVAPGQTVTTGFTVADIDSAAQTATDGTTSVVATAVATRPGITGTTTSEAMTDATTLKPFANVTITDVNFGQTETVTVTLSAAASGILSNLGGGSYNAATGVYTDIGTAALVTAAVDALIFTPITPESSSGATVPVSFTIGDTDTAGASAGVATTNVVITVPPTKVIASNGTTTLVQVGNQFLLDPAGTVAAGYNGPWVEYNGSPVTAGQFGSAVTPVGAEKTASGYEIAWSTGSNQYVVWNLGTSGNYSSAATGVLPGTGYALQQLEQSFGEDLNNDGTIGPVSKTIASNGTLSLVQVANQYALENGGTIAAWVGYSGSPVTAGQFGSAVTPVGAEKTASGYEIAWSTGSNQYVVWNLGTSGNYSSAATGVLTGTGYALQQLEQSFGEDLNNDGTIGPVSKTIASNGTLSLVQVANQYALENGGTIAAWVGYGGSPVTAGQFGSAVTPVGAEKTASGYEIAWSKGSNQYVVWNLGTSGNYSSAATGVLTGTGYALQQLEQSFGEDLNNDGTIGPVSKTIASNGTLSLVQVANQYALENGGTIAAWVGYSGSPVTAGQFGSAVTPVGAEKTASGYEIAWSTGSNQYVVWNLGTSGNYSSAATGVLPGTGYALQQLEQSFGEDLNNDGTIGPVSKTIASNGTLSLVQVANQYALENGGTIAAWVGYSGSPVTAGQFGSAVTPVGAEKTASGYEIAWSTGSNQYVVWNLGTSGNYSSAATGVLTGTGYALQQLEQSFGEDLNNDGTIGPVSKTIASNGTLSLVQVANQYALENGGTIAAWVGYSGSPVTAGQFGSAVTPVGAEKTASGYEIAWSTGSNQYVVWNLGTSGNYTSSATGVVSGQSFALEDLEPAFGEDLNGDGRLSTVLVTATGTGNKLDLTGQTQATTINLGANTASASAGLKASSLAFIGTPDAVTAGSAADTIEYTLAPGSGVETIANFTLGLDELNIDLAGAAAGVLQAYDTKVGGLHAIAIASNADLSHGLVLLNIATSLTAADLLASHTTFSGGHALIT